MKERKIPVKDMKIIEKWAQGASARRKFKKLVIQKQLQSLKYPEYKDNTIMSTEESLFTEKEIFLMTDAARQKNYFFSTIEREIGKKK